MTKARQKAKHRAQVLGACALLVFVAISTLALLANKALAYTAPALVESYQCGNYSSGSPQSCSVSPAAYPAADTVIAVAYAGSLTITVAPTVTTAGFSLVDGGSISSQFGDQRIYWETGSVLSSVAMSVSTGSGSYNWGMDVEVWSNLPETSFDQANIISTTAGGTSEPLTIDAAWSNEATLTFWLAPPNIAISSCPAGTLIHGGTYGMSECQNTSTGNTTVVYGTFASSVSWYVAISLAWDLQWNGSPPPSTTTTGSTTTTTSSTTTGSTVPPCGGTSNPCYVTYPSTTAPPAVTTTTLPICLTSTDTTGGVTSTTAGPPVPCNPQQSTTGGTNCDWWDPVCWLTYLFEPSATNITNLQNAVGTSGLSTVSTGFQGLGTDVYNFVSDGYPTWCIADGGTPFISAPGSGSFVWGTQGMIGEWGGGAGGPSDLCHDPFGIGTTLTSQSLPGFAGGYTPITLFSALLTAGMIVMTILGAIKIMTKAFESGK